MIGNCPYRDLGLGATAQKPPWQAKGPGIRAPSGFQSGLRVQTRLQKERWFHKTQEGTENLCLPFLQKQSKDRFGLEGDEESTMLEESVSPKK